MTIEIELTEDVIEAMTEGVQEYVSAKRDPWSWASAGLPGLIPQARSAEKWIVLVRAYQGYGFN